MNHIEIEYKTLLTESEHQLLALEFSGVAPVTQTNYYLDTPDQDIKLARYSLRMRTIGDYAELTLKMPHTVGILEKNQILSPEERYALQQSYQVPQGEIREQLIDSCIPLNELSIWGQLTTIRYEKQLAIGLLALDENYYGKQHDFELEMEVSNPQQGKEDFERFLTEKGIAFKHGTSKIARTAKEFQG